MIITDNDTKARMLKNAIHRDLRLEIDNTIISSENIVAESLELTHAICDGQQFVLGGCIAGQLSVKVININTELNGKQIKAYIKETYLDNEIYPSNDLYPSDNLYCGLQKNSIEKQIFTGTIFSSVRQKNRTVKEIIAYDNMYAMSQVKCAVWLKGYIEHSNNYTLKNLIETALFQFENLTGKEYDIGSFKGFNDDSKLKFNTSLTNTVPDDLVVSDLLKAYCELNSCFAIIAPDGSLKFTNLYISENKTTKSKLATPDEEISSYADLSFEEYTTKPINLLKLKYNKDQYYEYGYGADQPKVSWYVSDNIITSLCSDVSKIAQAFYVDKKNYFLFYDLYSYRPYSAELFSHWWIEPGDAIKFATGFDDVKNFSSFVFERTIKGINGIKTTIKAQGTETIGKDEIGENV